MRTNPKSRCEDQVCLDLVKAGSHVYINVKLHQQIIRSIMCYYFFIFVLYIARIASPECHK